MNKENIFSNSLEDESVVEPIPDTKDNQRQQDKIIAAVERNNDSIIGNEYIDVREDEYDDYLVRLSLGKLDKNNEDVVKNIVPNFNRGGWSTDESYREISEDKHQKAIVARFTKGSLKERDSLTSVDLKEFIKDFPDAISYENAMYAFLDEIEKRNGTKKRLEYEYDVDDFGQMVYGKQWEYLQQVKLLEKKAETICNKKTEEYNRNGRLSGLIPDRFMDGGRYAHFNGREFEDAGREILVVDRKMDSNLQSMINDVDRIKEKYNGDSKHIAFEIAQLVYNRMYSPNCVQVVRNNLHDGEEVLIGDISSNKGLPGVCRHRALLFQVLASEAGLDSSIQRGYMRSGMNGEHTWNEISINGQKYIVDIMNPPSRGDFKHIDYAKFHQNGGFPKPGDQPYDRCYQDVDGNILYPNNYR